jgi:lipopolysaccharide/colanic/teichoic acid biosynthesis glycosyltransferase
MGYQRAPVVLAGGTGEGQVRQSTRTCKRRQTYIRGVAGGIGRWVTSDFHNASRPAWPGGSVDSDTVASILRDVEGRGGFLDRPATPLPTEREFSPRRVWVKYGLDRVLAALMLIALTPILLLLIVLVKSTSRGPVLFCQLRIGQNGRGFVMFKFRSMRQPTALVRFEPVPGLAPGGVEGEDRRTAVGRVIRALSIDELPQLVNVLCGEMSLVGPRPERPQYVARFSRDLPGYAERHLVRPGITGWAQVHGCRGATSISNRLELDREYIQFWSLWLDIKILVLTCATVAGMAFARNRADQEAVEVVGRRQPSQARRHAGAPGGATSVLRASTLQKTPRLVRSTTVAGRPA